MNSPLDNAPPDVAGAGLRPEGLAAAGAARLMGVSLSHFYQLHKTGRLPQPIRLGRSVRWRRSELMDWLAAGAPSRSRWQVMKGAK